MSHNEEMPPFLSWLLILGIIIVTVVAICIAATATGAAPR